MGKPPAEAEVRRLLATRRAPNRRKRGPATRGLSPFKSVSLTEPATIRLMSILRKILVVFLAGLLPFFLLVLAFDITIIRALGSSDSIKKPLADSDIYSVFVPGVLEQIKISDDGGGGFSFNDPNVKAVAERTFTPQFLQENTEKVLDSVYRWLDSKTSIPDFKIDISSLKDTFIAEAAKVAQERAAGLPACPSGLSGADDFDPFSADCLPRGVTPVLAGAQIKDSLNSSDSFLKDAVVTADTIKSGNSNQSAFADQLKDVPGYYQKAKQTPFYLAILSLLITLGVIFLSVSRTHGLRRVGISLLSVGIVLFISAWALNWGVNQKALPSLKLDNKVLQEKLTTLAKDVTQNLNQTNYLLGGTYVLLGTLAIGVPLLVRRSRGPQPPVREPAVHTPTVSEPPAMKKPEPKPKPPKKPPVKIQ